MSIIIAQKARRRVERARNSIRKKNSISRRIHRKVRENIRKSLSFAFAPAESQNWKRKYPLYRHDAFIYFGFMPRDNGKINSFYRCNVKRRPRSRLPRKPSDNLHR